MKIILSRKGFDSSAGGRPSPIYEDKFISIPIPEAESGIRYRELAFNEEHNYLKVMKDLKINFFTEAHLDPDLRKSSLRDRQPGWRPMFGQDGRAQKHLENCDIGKSEAITEEILFLFWGWFKKVTKNGNGTFEYIKGEPDIHAIWGYLEVGEIIKPNKKGAKIPEWMKYHPHIVFNNQYENNTLYIASDKLGAGIFEYHKEKLVLTEENETRRSIWELPACFNGCEITHLDLDFKNEKITLQSPGRGQEFVVTKDPNQKVENWARNLIEKCPKYEKYP